MRDIFRLGFAASLVCMLVACADPVQDARDRLEIVKGGGSSAEICKAHRELVAKVLEAKDREAYKLEKAFADVACLTAVLDAQDAG